MAESAPSSRPKPKREWLPLEQLTFDLRLQQRVIEQPADGTPGRPYSETHVLHLLAAREVGQEFPPLEVVADGKKWWVFGGFNRGEMYRRAGVGSVECLVYPGTFADAALWSLSENSRHGLNRTPADCRKAFDTLTSNPDLLKRVLAGVREGDGVHRALARACGISKGAVGKYLPLAGLKATRTGQLVAFEPSTEPAPAPMAEAIEPAAAAATTRPSVPRIAAHPPATHTPERPRQATAGHGAKPRAVPLPPDMGENLAVLNPTRGEEPAADGGDQDDAAAVALDRTQRAAATLQQRFDELMAGPTASHLLRHAARHGAKIAKVETLSSTAGPRVESLYAWSPLQLIQAVLSDMAAGLVSDLYERRAVV